jgi:hypothetical protein
MSLAVTERITFLVWVMIVVAAGGLIDQWGFINGIGALTYLSQASLSKSQSIKRQYHPGIIQNVQAQLTSIVETFFSTFVEVVVTVAVGVLIGGSAHRHPEEMPFDPFLSAQVKGFCGGASCLFSFIRGGFVTMGDGGGRSQTNEVYVLIFVSRVMCIRT